MKTGAEPVTKSAGDAATRSACEFAENGRLADRPRALQREHGRFPHSLPGNVEHTTLDDL
jgi:hypothetical protein